MAALLIGYARCSTDQQDLTAQRDGLAAPRCGSQPGLRSHRRRAHRAAGSSQPRRIGVRPDGPGRA